ncbi:MAG: DUF86 domain-containing protein [Verrucomicrobiota bacterium]|nr:DUF86 domain-containing protein [Verrucomicrobiota bacterium]
MVNESIVYRLLNNIKSYLHDLTIVENITFNEYKNDIKTQRFVERTLQITIEAMLDVTHHIISDEKLREPNSYADAFTVLHEQQIIADEFIETAKQIAQFRNKLVHHYEKIDPEIVYGIFLKKSKDIEVFIKNIEDWLEHQKEN